MRRSGGLIPRKQIPARRVIETRNEFNEIVSTTTTNFMCQSCTVQPIGGQDFTPDLIGYINKEIYTLYTNTQLLAGVEGSYRKPDEVQINGKWFKVLKVHAWQVGVIPHYQAIVVEKDTGLL